jgi:hypothetical protein
MAKPHTNVWGWASDHWFLTFLLAWSAIGVPYAIVRAATPKLPAGGTPFPPGKP